MTHALLIFIIFMLFARWGVFEYCGMLAYEYRKWILWSLFGVFVLILSLNNTYNTLRKASEESGVKYDKWKAYEGGMKAMGLTIPDCPRYITEEKDAREKGCIINLALQGDDPTLQYRALLEDVK